MDSLSRHSVGCSHSRRRQKAMKIIRIQCVEQAVQTPPASLGDERTICKTKICHCFCLIRASGHHLPSNEHTQSSHEGNSGKEADRWKRVACQPLHTSSWQPSEEENHSSSGFSVGMCTHLAPVHQGQNPSGVLLHTLHCSVHNSMIVPSEHPKL